MHLKISIPSILCVLMVSFNHCFGQRNTSEIADDYSSVQDTDINYEERYENLVQTLAHPINLNKATPEDLRLLKILTETQIRNFIRHKAVNGDFLSVYELQAIPGFTLSTLYALAPLVEVNDPAASVDRSLLTRLLSEGDRYLLFRYERTLETKKGETIVTPEDRFKGSPDKLYLRFRSSQPGDFSIGFTAEKDAGEAITWRTATKQYGADFLSFHVQLQNKQRIKNLIIGDYQSQFAQGLVFGGMLGMGKGSETVAGTRSANVGILPYTSAYEAGYWRGIAATVHIANNIYVTGLYSKTARDATVSSDDDDFISSFQTTGLHRNDTELSKRKTIGEINTGMVIQYKRNQLDAGILLHHLHYEVPVARKALPYNQFSFNGRGNNNLGVYLNYTLHNVTFFSEIAQTWYHGNALIGGAICSITNHLDVSLLYRKFAPDFYPFYSNAFAESSTPQNESGLYWGWKYQFNKKYTASGYMDLFRFPWLKYRSYAPAHGHEWMARLTWQPRRGMLAFIQLREESKPRNLSESNTNVYQTGMGVKRNYWISFDYRLSLAFRRKTRAQFSTFTFQGKKTKGSAIMQDASFEAGRFQFTGRYALFDTEDYDNRLYAYENDVWLAYSLPAYFGVGLRRYIMIEYKMSKQLSFWLRYSQTRYTDREENGSGLDTIDKNVRNDIKFEARLRF